MKFEIKIHKSLKEMDKIQRKLNMAKRKDHIKLYKSRLTKESKRLDNLMFKGLMYRAKKEKIFSNFKEQCDELVNLLEKEK